MARVYNDSLTSQTYETKKLKDFPVADLSLFEAIRNDPGIDNIRRQDAIDALCNQCSMTKAGDRCTDVFCRDVRSLKEVPSAQPEIIHCGDCRYWKNDHLCECLSRYGTFETESYFYCGFAEGRESYE